MQKPIWILSKSGKTIDDAVNGLQGELANRVFFGHLRIIVVNQALAQTVGMQDIQDFFFEGMRKFGDWRG
jgi:spore germination protein KC